MSLLNSPLEASLRLLVALDVAAPHQHTLDELLVLDHIAMHSEDFGGPESVHPALPLRSADLGARREQIRSGVELLAHHGLATLSISPTALVISAGDDSRALVATLHSVYLRRYEERATWVREQGFVSTPAHTQASLRQIVASWSIEDGDLDGNS